MLHAPGDVAAMTELMALPTLDTAPLFPALHSRLVQLLRELAPEDWERPTVAGGWRVRDVVAHLLDGALRTLAAHRDGHALGPDGPVSAYDDVLTLIHRLNSTGVAFGQRLSRRLLIDLVDLTGQWLSTFLASLDPEAPALFGVAWAGESVSDNRFDTAREYTERWHHQMQIRDAVGGNRPDVLLAREFLRPLLETSVRVLPHAYRHSVAAGGTCIVLRLTSSDPLAWTLVRDVETWRLHHGEASAPDAVVSATPDALWRLFYNGLTEPTRHPGLVVQGPQELTAPLLAARSVMV